MKRFLVFKTPTVMDFNNLCLMGVSVKDNDSPIGFFGTGLKYALAATLRLGGEMHIIIDGKHYDVTSQSVTIRNKEFQQVVVGGKPLGFTTELGKTWESWQIIRELYSNTLDERGTVTTDDDVSEFQHVKAHTFIAIEGADFAKIWEKRYDYFIDFENEKPIYTSDFLDCYPNPTESRSVFYKGIKVHEPVNRPLYRYNIKEDVDLTEDRTLKYSWNFTEAVEKMIMTSDSVDMIKELLGNGETFESKSGFDTDSYVNIQISDAFKSAVEYMKLNKPRGHNSKAVQFLKNRNPQKIEFLAHEVTPEEQTMIDYSKAFLYGMGFKNELDRFPIDVVAYLGENRFGLAKDNTIIISKDCFDKGKSFLAATILEEMLHLHYGFIDESRVLQNWLFEKVIALGEVLASREELKF